MEPKIKPGKKHGRFFTSELVLLVLTLVSGLGILWVAFTGFGGIYAQLFVGVVFTISIVVFIRLRLDPDSYAARQSDELLTLSSQTLECLRDGLTSEAAQQICALLLPVTPAIAVSITDCEKILGYAGYNAANNPAGAPIRTAATHEVVTTGEPRVLYTNEDIGLPPSSSRINGAIVQPLIVGHKVQGAIKFYYRRASQISHTQLSIAHGFAELISTQMASIMLEEQTRLATSMELKALQAQINPHFLFNTINTIASLIRTDPNKARTLLREFAVFYRSTLEDANDLIPLDRELKQVERYFSFEVARFGEERLSLEMDIDPTVREMMVPSFLVQPLVENSVRHGMRSEGKLTISIRAAIEGDNVIISVSDDGMGMTEEKLATMMSPESSQGLGIAVRNVHDRMVGYFGPESRMNIESTLDVGTTVSYILKREAVESAFLTSDTADMTPYAAE